MTFSRSNAGTERARDSYAHVYNVCLYAARYRTEKIAVSAKVRFGIRKTKTIDEEKRFQGDTRDTTKAQEDESRNPAVYSCPNPSVSLKIENNEFGTSPQKEIEHSLNSKQQLTLQALVIRIRR